jgi:hypothetical protein
MEACELLPLELLSAGEQRGGREIKGLRQHLHRRESRIRLGALDLANMVSVESALNSYLFLGKVELFADAANGEPKGDI